MKQNNKIIDKIIQESISKVVNENFAEIENMPTYEVFNEHSCRLSLTEIDEILESFLYDKNDNCVGKLSDLHFKYDTNRNRILGSSRI